jgi:hypothetical protein
MGCGWGGDRVEALEDAAAVRVREEVAVEVERDADRRVPHLRLQILRMSAGGDHQRGVGVTEVVDLGWRLVEGAKRRAALLLEDEAVGVLPQDE